MTTKREQRARELTDIQNQIPRTLFAIEEMVEQFPERANLATWRAIRNSVARCHVEVRGFIERETARREARNG